MPSIKTSEDILCKNTDYYIEHDNKEILLENIVQETNISEKLQDDNFYSIINKIKTIFGTFNILPIIIMATNDELQVQINEIKELITHTILAGQNNKLEEYQIEGINKLVEYLDDSLFKGQYIGKKYDYTDKNALTIFSGQREVQQGLHSIGSYDYTTAIYGGQGTEETDLNTFRMFETGMLGNTDWRLGDHGGGKNMFGIQKDLVKGGDVYIELKGLNQETKNILVISQDGNIYTKNGILGGTTGYNGNISVTQDGKMLSEGGKFINSINGLLQETNESPAEEVVMSYITLVTPTPGTTIDNDTVISIDSSGSFDTSTVTTSSVYLKKTSGSNHLIGISFNNAGKRIEARTVLPLTSGEYKLFMDEDVILDSNGNKMNLFLAKQGYIFNVN